MRKILRDSLKEFPHDLAVVGIVHLAAKKALRRSQNMKAFRVARAIAVIALFTVPFVVARNQSRSAPSSAQQQSPSSSATTTTASSEAVQSGTSRIITAYSLPPDLHKKARSEPHSFPTGSNRLCLWNRGLVACAALETGTEIS